MVGREGVHGRGNSIEVALKAEALGRRDDVTLLLLLGPTLLSTGVHYPGTTFRLVTVTVTVTL